MVTSPKQNAGDADDTTHRAGDVERGSGLARLDQSDQSQRDYQQPHGVRGHERRVEWKPAVSD